MVRGKQESKTSGVVLAVKKTWVQFEQQVPGFLKTRLKVAIQNNGVENDQSTGILYITFGEPGVTETVDPFDPTFDPGVLVLQPGGSGEWDITKDVAINLNTDTDGLGVAVTEIESTAHYSKQD